MTIPLSWKVAGVAVGLIAIALAWNGVSQYLASRHADEIIQESARAAAIDAQQAQARTQQRHDELAANLRQQRAELASNYRQVADEGREHQARRAIQLAREQQEAQRLAAHRHQPPWLDLQPGQGQGRTADPMPGEKGC